MGRVLCAFSKLITKCLPITSGRIKRRYKTKRRSGFPRLHAASSRLLGR